VSPIDGISPIIAAVYCRVSSLSQTEKGDGLRSQETRCRDHARTRGYEVIAAFHDQITGRALERPGMNALLKTMRRYKAQGFVVVIDDQTRFSRDVETHIVLRRKLKEAGGRLESPSMEFGEEPHQILVENINASVSQHQRQLNANQTRNRMMSRVQNGYWPFHPPLGYKQERVKGQGKMMVRDEPMATVIQEALEGYACGRFQSQTEVRVFLEKHPDFMRGRRGNPRRQIAKDLFTKPLYAGLVEYAPWGVTRREGQHEGLISVQTFERIQQRLNGSSYAPMRKDSTEQFPLRGAVCCATCSNPMTSCFSTSKTGAKHPYYKCFTKACVRYGKSIRRDQIETAFTGLLARLSPSPQLFGLAKAMLREAWTRHMAQASNIAKGCEEELSKIERQIATLVDRIVEATSSAAIAAYEKKIAALENRKLLVDEQRRNTGKGKRTFDELFELAFQFLASPLKLWEKGDWRNVKWCCE
jgi:site-specific DNA recombinase